MLCGMSDRLTLAQALEGAKIERGAAEKIATEIYDAIHLNVATKGDIRELRIELQTVKTELESNMAALESRLKVWMGSVGLALATLLFAALHMWPPR